MSCSLFLSDLLMMYVNVALFSAQKKLRKAKMAESAKRNFEANLK